MKLDIAIAKFRFQKIWHNEQWTWGQLVNRLSATQRTAETYDTYTTSPKPRQAEIKDVGGFVGGYLTEGIRRKGHTLHRQVLTLDIDFGYSGLWDDFQMYYPNISALVYSTHAHSPVSPRLRLVLPLSRPATPEEYEAVARKVASLIGMEAFDSTTFQPDRLMYWPSTSRDGEYYFRKQEGEWLDVDEVLSKYRNWKDVSEWPMCPTETEIAHRSDIKRQEDPTEKKGLIGAFCRTYSVSEAIETFLSDIYTPGDTDDRYTYIHGSTANGAVVYEDKFLYSHHSTDPVHGHQCNAFDLVRVHKFGAMDGDTSLPVSKRPSFSAMSDLARRDAGVIKEQGIFDTGADPEESDWMSEFEMDKKGNRSATIANICLIIRNDPDLKGKYAYNEFNHCIYIEGKEEFDNVAGAELRNYIEKMYGIYNPGKFKDAFLITTKEHKFHPVKDYLNSLSWDGVERLDSLFIDTLGAPDTPYTRAVTRKSLTACVTRIMNPGCKFDYMVVFIGKQGKGKSSLLFDLGKEWFSDTLDSITDKDAYMQISRAWILEMAELSATKKAEVEAVKKFITKREDIFRPPYGESLVTYKRHTVFFGSTNEYEFLKDPTGNRRFWPLVVNKEYSPGSLNPDQIWAEAVYRYNHGENLYLTKELEAMAEAQQLEHSETDHRSGLIEAFVEMRLPHDWDEKSMYERNAYVGDYQFIDDQGYAQRDKVCVAEIWCELFRNKQSEMTAYNTRYIHTALANMEGWKRTGTLSYKKYGYQRSYVRIGGEYDKENRVTEELIKQE